MGYGSEEKTEQPDPLHPAVIAGIEYDILNPRNDRRMQRIRLLCLFLTSIANDRKISGGNRSHLTRSPVSDLNCFSGGMAILKSPLATALADMAAAMANAREAVYSFSAVVG